MMKYTVSKDGMMRCTRRAEIRLTEEEYRKLKEWAKHEECTTRDIIERALCNGMENEWLKYLEWEEGGL